MKQLDVIGLRLACTDYSGATAWIHERMSLGDRAYAVEAANTHVAALARSDEEFGKAMARFDLIVPDGMPLVWSLNHQLSEAEKLNDRVYGPDLMLEVIKAQHSEAKSFFLGGAQSTLDKLERYFSQNFPSAQIAGVYSPPFGEWPEDEFDKICRKIKESGANLIWVGLGCPKQEKWIAKHLDDLPAGVYFGIGAAFAFHAGEVKQAPKALQSLGLEWLFRLAMEPRRLWKRYFVHNTLFLFYTVRDFWRNREDDYKTSAL
ncbi:MAG: WecB/TagA/CpsF family glycosyltransferase [Verrucomicrobiales bacterium]